MCTPSSIRLVAIAGLWLALGSLPATAATYYVAPTGADNGPGTATQPWHSVATAAQRAYAGDLVVVQAGVYRESVALTRAGVSGAPIVLRGLPGAVLTSPDPSRSLSAFDFASQSAFITIQGFELGGGFAETVFLRPGSHDIELAGLHIHDNHTGIWIAGASNVFIHDCDIEHNYRTGIRMYDSAQRIRIVDTIAAYNDDGAGCDGASDGFNTDESVTDVMFERASAIGNSQDGFDLKGPNVTLLGATAANNGCTGVKVWAGGYLEDVVVQGHNVGVSAGAPDGVTTVLQNCTLAQNALGVRVLSSAQIMLIRNSIVSGDGKAVSYEAPAQLIEHHNIFYRPRSTDRLIVYIQGTAQTLYSGDDVNNARWQRASGQGQGTVAVDPKLDAASGEPGAGSPALDCGDPSGSPAVDRVGMPRPQGIGIDRGAFERAAGNPTLLVQSVTLRGDRTGSGRVRLLARVADQPALRFDPRRDEVTISMRSAGGEVAAVTVPPSAWTASRAAPRLFIGNSSGRLQELKLMVDGSGVRLWVSTAAADLWACDGAALTITVQLGMTRASADMPMQAVGSVLTASARRQAPSLRRR